MPITSLNGECYNSNGTIICTTCNTGFDLTN